MSGKISIEYLPDRLCVSRNNRHAFSYVYRGIWRPYFWPINIREGNVVRGVNGIEHPNQYGLNLSYGGHRSETTTSIWSDYDEPPYGPCGRMVHDEFKEVRSLDDETLRIEEITVWTNDRGHLLGRDQRRFEIRFLPDDELLFLIQLQMTPPTDPEPGDVTISARVADSLRVSPEYDEEDHTPGQITNSRGNQGEGNTRGVAAEWCDYAGELGGGQGGIALINHPSGGSEPAEIFTRAYGIMSTSQRFKQDRRRSHTFKWGAYAHNGLTDDSDIDDIAGRVASW